jgi:Ni,Fe-hydrogenase maturation factor
MLGYQFDTVIIGVEPEDISPWSDALTATVRDKVPDLVRSVLEEVARAGGHFTPIPVKPCV